MASGNAAVQTHDMETGCESGIGGLHYLGRSSHPPALEERDTNHSLGKKEDIKETKHKTETGKTKQNETRRKRNDRTRKGRQKKRTK